MRNDRNNNRILFARALAAVLGLLAALCALALPWRAARLIDVGVRRGGVEYATPLRIRASTLEDLRLFFDTDTAAKVTRAYDRTDDVYVLRDAADAARLSDALALPVLQYLRLSEQGVNTFPAIRAAMENGTMTAADVTARAEEAVAAMGDLPPEARTEAATAFVRTEYAVSGGDLNALRQEAVAAELWRMAGLAALGLLAMGLGAWLAARANTSVCTRVFSAGLALGAAACGFACCLPAGAVLAAEALALLFAQRRGGAGTRRAVACVAGASTAALLPVVTAARVLALRLTPGLFTALLLWAVLAALALALGPDREEARKCGA